ncbi:MAG: hypothetical protein V4703_12890 [Actinomycetota bacterium]
MADWIVALTGNDTTGTGTLGNPFLTVTKALSVGAPGDRAVVRDIPNGPVIKFGGFNLGTAHSGTALTPKLIVPYPGEQPVFAGSCKFGDSTTSKSNYVEVVGSDDIRFNSAADTIVFEQSTNGQHTVEMYATGCKVRGCIIDKLGSYLGSCVAMGYQGAGGQYRAVSCEATHNLIRNVGLDPSLTSSQSGHDHAAYLNYNLDCRIEFNVIVDIAGGWGIHLYTESTSARDITGTVVSHNTIVNTRDGGIILACDGTSKTEDTVVTFNLCVDCGDGSLSHDSYSFMTFMGGVVGTGNVGSNNHSFNPGDGHVQSPLTGWTLAAPSTGDPLFIDAAGGDYHLNPASSALGIGALGAGDIDTTPPSRGTSSSARGAAMQGAAARGAFTESAAAPDPVALSVQSFTRAGVVPVFAAAPSGGARIRPGPRTWLHVRNASGGPVTVTPVTTFVDGLGNPSLSTPVVVGAGAERVAGPFPAEAYEDPEDGLMGVVFSATSGVTVALLSIAEGVV